MLKKTVLAVALASALLMTGCANKMKQLRNQNESLEQRLADKDQQLSIMQKKLDALDRNKGTLESRIAELEKEKTGITQVLDTTTAQKSELEKQREELEALLKDLSGIKVKQGAEGNYIVMDNKILFAPGKIAIGAEGKEALKAVADYLKKYPGQIIRIDGHTDSDPIKRSGWKSNHQLAAMRAHAVFSELKALKVNPRRMYIVGFGPIKPEVEEKTDEDKQQNRRVEILMVPPKSRVADELLKPLSAS